MPTTEEMQKMDRATYTFASSSEAWAFYRACDGAKIPVGFPALRAPYTVEALIPTWQKRDEADAFAGALPTDYRFASEGKPCTCAAILGLPHPAPCPSHG